MELDFGLRFYVQLHGHKIIGHFGDVLPIAILASTLKIETESELNDSCNL